MEEARKRDHRILGKKLDLFSIQVSNIDERYCREVEDCGEGG
jgi:threonyl-tRNA synthetase